MNAKTAQHWEQTRTQGKWWFTIYRGVLAWGLPIGIITGMIRVYDYHTFQIDYVDFLINLTGFMIGGGLIFGLGAWYITEEEYRWYIEKANNKNRNIVRDIPADT